MRTQQQDQDGTRTLYGYVSAAGAPISGTGYSVIRNAVGDYTVRFQRPFRGPPSITLGFGPNTNAGGRVQAQAADSCQIYAYNAGAGSLQDTAFNFHARGLS
jgi:hypothetical protein